METFWYTNGYFFSFIPSSTKHTGSKLFLCTKEMLVLYNELNIIWSFSYKIARSQKELNNELGIYFLL